MRILIVGASGLVGRHLLRDLRQMFGRQASVVGTYHAHPIDGGVPLDIRDAKAIGTCLKTNSPDVVIWLAGSKDVPFLEREPGESTAVNEVPIRSAVDAIATFSPSTKLVYLSSDYVYCGKLGGYRDADHRAPDTIYGKSKVFAEDVLMTSGLNVVCVRTAAIMSCHGGFLRWLLDALTANERVSLYGNTVFSPTPPLFLSRALRYMIDTGVASKAVNFGGPAVSRYTIGRHFCLQFGHSVELMHETTVDFSRSTLHPDLSLVTSGEFMHLAPRTLDDFGPETCS